MERIIPQLLLHYKCYRIQSFLTPLLPYSLAKLSPQIYLGDRKEARFMDVRNQATTASGLNVLAGIWLIIAPFVLGYTLSTPTTNDIWVGIVVGVLALIRVFTPMRAMWLSWVNIVLGIWVIISPFVLGYSYYATARWNDIILGIIVAVLAIWSSGATAMRPSREARA